MSGKTDNVNNNSSIHSGTLGKHHTPKHANANLLLEGTIRPRLAAQFISTQHVNVHAKEFAHTTQTGFSCLFTWRYIGCRSLLKKNVKNHAPSFLTDFCCEFTLPNTHLSQHFPLYSHLEEVQKEELRETKIKTGRAVTK